MDIDPKQFRVQVRQFAKVERRKYKIYAKVLEKVFEKAMRALAPQAIVQARAKSVSSFAEKIVRKKKYTDPFAQMTDLCGARIITHTKADVLRIIEFIENNFAIDKDNSKDLFTLLKANEFGYRSVHSIIQFRPGQYPTDAIQSPVPQEVIGLKAEVQVRTIAQHCWADIGHDRIYKSPFTVPEKWVRESALAAALLEDVDETFARLVQGLGAYRTSYGTYLTEKQIAKEIEILETVRRFGDREYQFALQIARLASSLGDWAQAVSLLKKCGGTNSAPLLLCYGFAMCQQHAAAPGGDGYKQGRGHLERAVQATPRDVDALATLADSWLGIDERKVTESYERAFGIEPFHPRTLIGYVIGRMAKEGNTGFLSLIRPGIDVALATCDEQARVGVNLPWAYYYAGALHLFLGQPYESLAAYSKAVKMTGAEFMIDAALAALTRLAPVADSLSGSEWVRRLLLLAKAAKFHNGELDPYSKTLASKQYKPIQDPVIIVAGGCKPELQHQLESFRPVLFDAFREYMGTIISGGTKEGISGLVGELAAKYEKIRAIGYIPRSVPHDARADDRYELRVTEGHEFTPLQPLQGWIDLLASGIQPSRVKLLGINGGPIAAFEYRLALILGAKVGVLDDSGREADKLIADSEWKTVKNLEQLLEEKLTLKDFTVGYRDALARRIHDVYLASSQADLAKERPGLATWEELSEDLKDANRKQADDIEPKLQEAGIRVYAVNDRDIQLLEFRPREVDFLAKREHDRWCQERREKGWTQGAPRDNVKKLHPDLVPFEDLTPNSQQKDRIAVLSIPKLLKEIKMELRRDPTLATP